MSKNKKTNLLDSKFYRVYFTCLAAAVVVILVGTVWLMGILRDVESAQPIYVARQVAQLFEAKDFSDIYALDTSAAQIAQGDKDFYVENMNAIAEGKTVDWSEAFSTDEDRRRYNVTLDGERFASFTVVPNGETTARGSRLWTLGAVTTYVTLDESAAQPEAAAPETTYALSITAPKGYAVTVDGVAVTAENAAATESPLFEEGFLPSGVEAPMLVKYEYQCPAAAPEVTVADAAGAAMTLEHPSEYVWSCGLRESAELQSQFSKAAYALAQHIARFTSKDGSKDAILKYCAKDSPARKKFNDLSNQYATPHSDIAFQNESVTEFYELSPDCFTCHVAFDYLMKTRAGVKTDHTTYTFCVVKQGGSGKLYNLLMM